MSRFKPLSRSRANLALYGTISLCTATTVLQLSTDTTLHQAHRTRDQTLFAKTLQTKQVMTRQFTCSLRNLREGRYYTLITSSWNHGSLMHYLGNMLGLWSFGRVIAYRYGAGSFLGLFYGGAVTGNLACLGLDSRFFSPSSSSLSSSKTTKNPLGEREARQDRNYIGASGGVSAVISAMACLNPWGTMIMFIGFAPVPVPNVFFPVGFAAFSVWAQTNGLQGNVAHLGHLGGLAYGFLWFLGKSRGLPV